MSSTYPIFTGTDYIFEKGERNGFKFILTVDRREGQPVVASFHNFVNNEMHEYHATAWTRNQAMDECIEKVKESLWEECNGT